jgi:outer membrane lipopolysaccharide assembly protein LptE/RlpB
MVLRLDSYKQKSRVVALDSNGYAREKELTVSLSYTVLTPQLEVLLSTRQIKLHEDILMDKDNVIASDRAVQETYQQLQRRLAVSLLNVLRFDLKGLNHEAGQ